LGEHEWAPLNCAHMWATHCS